MKKFANFKNAGSLSGAQGMTEYAVIVGVIVVVAVAAALMFQDQIGGIVDKIKAQFTSASTAMDTPATPAP